MKKAKAKLIILALVCLAALLYACGETGGGESAGTAATNANDGGGAQIETEAATEDLRPAMPEVGYGGYEFKVLVMGPAHAHYQSREIGADSESGEIINDAVYKRNMYVEKALDVRVKAIPSNAVMADAKKTILAGSTDYDVVMPIVDDAVKAIQPGMFYDLNILPYIDLTKPWWDPRVSDSLTINGKCYFATGDISILDNECTMVIFFNKGIIRDNALEDPYKLVREGRWTLDREYELSKGISRDIDGDGVLTVGDDMFGMQISSNTPHSMFFGAGEKIVGKNAEGGFEFAIFNERSVNVVQKIMEICSDPSALTPKTKGGSDYSIYIPNFGRGNILFSHLALVDMGFFRNDDVDFGILPYPKYDDNQKEYNNFISTIMVPVVAVPGNCENTERTGAVIELMAYEAVATLTYAYYDQTLNARLIRDEESSDMLDIIFKTRVYDMGFMFNWGGMGLMLQDMYAKRNFDFVSNYEKTIEKAIAAMEKSFAVFEN